MLERNPDYRECATRRRAALPTTAEGQALLARFSGRRLPMIDGVEIRIIEESQPRWLSLPQRRGRLRACRAGAVAASRRRTAKLAPNLAKQGIRLQRYVNPDVAMSVLQHGGPGGRRLHAGKGRAAPRDPASRTTSTTRSGSSGAARRSGAGADGAGTYGLRSGVCKSENSDYDVARAKALLDIVRLRRPQRRRLARAARRLAARHRRWRASRSRSTASTTRTGSGARAAIGVRMVFETAQWAEHMKTARAGTLQMWFLGSTATHPDGQGALEHMYGESIGQSNLARFKLPAFDDIYRRMLDLPRRSRAR